MNTFKINYLSLFNHNKRFFLRVILEWDNSWLLSEVYLKVVLLEMFLLVMCSSRNIHSLRTEGFFIWTLIPLGISIPEGFVKTPSPPYFCLFFTLISEPLGSSKLLYTWKIDGLHSYNQFFLPVLLLYRGHTRQHFALFLFHD